MTAIPNLTHLPPMPPIEIGVCNKKQAQACSFAPLAACLSTFSMAAYELCFLKIKIGIKKALCPGECPLFTGFDGKN